MQQMNMRRQAGAQSRTPSTRQAPAPFQGSSCRCVQTQASRANEAEPVALSQPAEERQSRRQLLMLAGVAAMAYQPALRAQANTFSATCAAGTDTEEEDTECRRSALAQDAGKQENYGSVTTRKFELAPNVPVATLDKDYVNATISIGDKITAYCTMDVYDKERIPLIKSLKQDGLTWVSKYARGGSARSQSARRMYTAVDSVVGHLAANGLAPLPRPKVQIVLKNVAEAKDFLAKGI